MADLPPQSPPTVLIIGGSGFIGTRLARRLAAAGRPFRIADLRPSAAFPEAWVGCDVRDPASLAGLFADVDWVLNLAAEHQDDVQPLSRYHDVNVAGARHVCAAAAHAGVHRLLFTSSVAVYGLPEGVVDESGPFRPFNEYGRTKLAAEGVYREWAAADPARSLVLVRPTVVFGEGNRGNVYNLFRQIASKAFLMVGDGRNRKSLAYVENVAAFLQHCLADAAGTRVYNYADGPDLSMDELVALVKGALGQDPAPGLRLPYALGYAGAALLDGVARLSGRRFPISRVRVRKFCASTRFDAGRAMASGFRPEVSLAEGIARTLQHDLPPAGQA